MLQVKAEWTTQRAVALLQRVGALRQGRFTLASGKISDYYFDSKQLTLDPDGAEFVAEQLMKRLDSEDIAAVGGTPYSAIPIVSHICLLSGIKGREPTIPAFYIRESSKGHGLDALLEGKLPGKGSQVAIVDDVVTSGKSVLYSINKAEEHGFEVSSVIALVDRNEGGRKTLEEKGYRFWALFTVCRTSEGELDIEFNGT